MNKLTKFFVAGSGALALLAAWAIPSFAASTATTTTTSTGSVTGGTLTMDAGGNTNGAGGMSGSFSYNLTSDGAPGQQFYASETNYMSGGTDPVVQVNDATGTGDGWTLSVQGSVVEKTPSAGFASGTSAIEWPAGSLMLGVPTVAPNEGQTSGTPTISITNPTSIIGSSPLNVSTAATNDGAGEWTFTWPSTDTSEANSMYTFVLPPKSVDTTNYPGTSTPYNVSVVWTVTQG